MMVSKAEYEEAVEAIRDAYSRIGELGKDEVEERTNIASGITLIERNFIKPYEEQENENEKEQEQEHE